MEEGLHVLPGVDLGDHVGPEEQRRASVQWARSAVQLSHAVEQKDGLPGRDGAEYGLEILTRAGTNSSLNRRLT